MLVPLNKLRRNQNLAIDSRLCRRLASVDTAGTSRQKAEERKGRPPSWSVCQIWDYWPKSKLLFLRYVWRDRVNWDGLKAGVRKTLRQWRPHTTLIENAHHGPPLRQELGSRIQGAARQSGDALDARAERRAGQGRAGDAAVEQA